MFPGSGQVDSLLHNKPQNKWTDISFLLCRSSFVEFLSPHYLTGKFLFLTDDGAAFEGLALPLFSFPVFDIDSLAKQLLGYWPLKRVQALTCSCSGDVRRRQPPRLFSSFKVTEDKHSNTKLQLPAQLKLDFGCFYGGSQQCAQ